MAVRHPSLTTTVQGYIQGPEGLELKDNLSKTQIDSLGDRLRKGPITESDLRLLDDHRRSFRAAYEIVIGRIRGELNFVTTGRPAKATSSIIEKLQL